MDDNIAYLLKKEQVEPVARFLRTRLVDLTPGRARVSIKVSEEHLNFNGLVFGGIITALIDEAFAYATNSLIRPSYASQLNVHFLAGASVGDELTAECMVLKSGRRVGISEMEVTDQAGKIIAKATGTTIPVVAGTETT
jgi:acyl-CoA thioesterase